MRNSENAFGYCEAGCPREVLSYADFEKSLPQYEKVAPDADGLTRLEKGILYKIIPPSGEELKIICEATISLENGTVNTRKFSNKMFYTTNGSGDCSPETQFSFFITKLEAFVYPSNNWGSAIYYYASLSGMPIKEYCIPYLADDKGKDSFETLSFNSDYLWTNGAVYTCVEHGKVLGAKDINLPAVTEDDNGKILAVSRGGWQVKNNA